MDFFYFSFIFSYISDYVDKYYENFELFLFLLGKWVRYEYSNPSVDYLLHTRIKLGGYGGGYEG